MKVRSSTGSSGGGMFKHIKDIDGATVERSSSPAAESYASDPTSGHSSSSKNPLGKFFHKFKADERLHRAEQYSEDALNRSEHDEITRPWHSHSTKHDDHYERRSFRNVKYIDEKDEAWQTKSCGGSVGGGVDHITDHYSDVDDSSPMNKSMSSLDRSDRHTHRSNQSTHHQHHETMLQVMERLAREEQEAKIAADVDKAMHSSDNNKNHPNCDAYLRRCYSNNDKREVSKGGSKSMLEAMEQLMGKESVKLGHVAERPKLTDPRKVKSEKPLQPALRKTFAPRA